MIKNRKLPDRKEINADFKMAKKSNPNIITIWGGPNFPIDFPSQKKFMKKYPEVDAYIPTEGEIGFSNVVKIV